MNIRTIVTVVLSALIAAGAYALGAMTNWGEDFKPSSVLQRVPPGKAVEAKVLPPPEVVAEASFVQTVERPLWVPTRRQSPAAVPPEVPKPTMKRGQFVLTGAIVAGDVKVAYLREVATNKSLSAKLGEQVNGLVVAAVEPRRVQLKFNEETEDLTLEVQKQVAAAAPVATSAYPQLAQQVAAPVPGQPPMPGQPQIPGQPVPGQIPGMPPGFRPGAQAGVPQPGVPQPGVVPPGVPQPGVAAPVPPPATAATPTQQPEVDTGARAARRRMWQNAQ